MTESIRTGPPTSGRPRPEPLDQLRLPSTDALVGRVFELSFVDGGSLRLDFVDALSVRWQADGPEWSGRGGDPVDVVAVADGTYFIDVDFDEPALTSATVVLSERTGWALVIHQLRFHPEDTWSRGPEVTHTFSAARVAGLVQQGPPPAVTRDLIGQRHFHRYSEHNLYEHIYLNANKFCGHNVHTFGTPGRADCHPVTYHKVDDDLYVVAWREYDSAAAMVSVLNLATWTVTGKVHHPADFLRSASRYFGGQIIPVDRSVAYPDDLTPI